MVGQIDYMAGLSVSTTQLFGLFDWVERAGLSNSFCEREKEKGVRNYSKG
jgi:hypothetical protein